MRITKTKDRFSVEGEYVKPRLFLHENILAGKQDGFPSQEKPIAFLMGGGSASGKSWLRKLICEEQSELGNEFLIIDADEIKELLPEHSELIQKYPEQAASVLHDESSDIASKLLDSSAQKSHNLIYDGTMKNYSKYHRIISLLKDYGYIIRIVIADVDIDEAIRRNDERFKATKRLVPKVELINSHVRVAEVFLKLKDQVDEYLLYDTFDDYTVFAYKNVDEGEVFKNQARLQVFLEKSNLKMIDGITSP
ncbi:zeta toxin family protein [Paenibacillus durus]|uniref:UDP-N-acetylglucosamine kinase n=1 Tax=Paenibacillus durus ATCC 35681 TaxID=1333534 RepID=A0A0F7CJM9_PAEDU|nr:zeta toxin family protein [Paenibacillus durus]AKG36316.1 hypothetical protein VK70_18565 [Paenibacillus durus ATCC 35681]